MKYYLIPEEMAERLGCREYRRGSAAHGYIVNQGDLAPIGVEAAIYQGAKELKDEEIPNR